MSPTPNAAQNCAEWLKWCRRNGWPKESTSRLCDLWWEFHDDEGNLVGEQPDLERFRETLVGMRSQSDEALSMSRGNVEFLAVALFYSAPWAVLICLVLQ